MPRQARIVFEGIPHHITHRGNHREKIFNSDKDFLCYKQWLNEYARLHGMEILAYCLMNNHIHLVAVPHRVQSFSRIMKSLNIRYAQRVNRLNNLTGHCWEGRFFSSPLDEEYMWAAIRYVELNPVKAKLVPVAELYPWSSAKGHCGMDCWSQLFSNIDQYLRTEININIKQCLSYCY